MADLFKVCFQKRVGLDHVVMVIEAVGYLSVKSIIAGVDHEV